jgi:transcriptional regulator with XRE-family HTH domain
VTPLPRDSVAEQFGRNLRRCRRRADISQEELSYAASVHRTEISQLERALRTPRIDTVIKLAGALEVPAGDLVGGIAWEPPAPAMRGGFRSPDGESAGRVPGESEG